MSWNTNNCNCRSSIFNNYIQNGLTFESLDVPRKEEEAVGFIAIQFIKNLQHDCDFEYLKTAWYSIYANIIKYQARRS